MADAVDDRYLPRKHEAHEENATGTTAACDAGKVGSTEAVFDALSDGVILRDKYGRVTLCNQVATRLLGLQPQGTRAGERDAKVPRTVEVTEAGSSVDFAEWPGCSACATGKPEAERLLGVRIGGNHHWVRARANPLLDERGAAAGSVTVLTDVTELVRTQEALRESASRLEFALEAGQLGLWELDTNTDSGWWSPNLDRLFTLGNRARGFAGLVAHVHQEDRFSLLTNAAQIFQGNDGDRLELEFRILGEDNEIRWVRIDGYLVVSSVRRCVRGTLVDITERRHLEEQLRKAQRLESIGRLAGGVAHDFNNLLSAMLSSLDLLEPESPEAIRSDLANLRNITLRGCELTRQLLAFAKRPFVERKVVDLGDVIAEVEVLLRRLVGPSIVLHVSVTHGLPVRGDAALLEQLIVGLVVLARDTIPRGGRISILGQRQRNDARHAEMSDDLVLVTIACANLPHLADSESTGIPGAGTRALATADLGVESFRAIAEQHGGTLTLENGSDQGIQLTLLLPCLASSDENCGQPTRRQRSSAQHARVLIIEDEDIVRDNLVRLTGSLGYDVQGAANAAEALAVVQKPGTHWDVVLCDIGIPGSDGPSLVAVLRAYAPSLRVIYMSGYTAEGEAERVEGERFLPKPFGREDLERALEGVLRVT
jgi:PAS domain-containing protein/CheY-like chemotaxis protein